MRSAVRCLVMLWSIFLLGTFAVSEEPKTTSKKSSEKGNSEGIAIFDQQIKPVLVKHCYKCHSKDAKEIEGGLELDSPAGLLRGGDSGPILVPHDIKHSPLIQMLRHAEGVSEMPPKKKLPEEVILAFEKWISLGAPDSRAKAGPTEKEKRLAAGQNHWSFQPPKLVKAPAVKKTDWPLDEIDHYLLARMESKGLKPSADANRRTLVRRVYFDLVGLPPTPKEVARFVTDKSPDAMAHLIDRLLDSPRFGERWGRHWLDVVRYAESSGMEFNFTYPHAWPYRNYVIDAFNQDTPFDVFVREQIAGDIIASKPKETEQEVEARHVALGMLAFGPKRLNSGGRLYQMDVADDQIDTICRSMLALTVGCARCHDHKFDPIPTKDYYAMVGIFLSTRSLHGTISQKYSNHPSELYPIGPGSHELESAYKGHMKDTARTESSLARAQKELVKATEEEKKAIAVQKKATEKKVAFDKSRAAATAQLSPNNDPTKGAVTGVIDGKEVAPVDPKKVAAAQEAKIVREQLEQANASLKKASERLVTLNKEIKQLETELAKLKKTPPPRPMYAMSVRELRPPVNSKIAIRGDSGQLGEEVPRGFLTAVKVTNPPSVHKNHSGREELAMWLTDKSNPLTARVMVNRIWHHLFGRGLVSTVDNFGLIGKPPSHPQLLDALAIRFMADGWSTKRMIRAIMLTRAYQLSSVPNTENMKLDPGNRFLWRATPRRLEVEVIRDAILAISGQLDLKRPKSSTVTPLGDKLVRAIPTEKLQPPSNHRSIYLAVVRDYVPEIFDLFDFPSPSLVSGRRSVTNVPSQALYLRNSPFVAEQAKHAAKRLLASKDAKDDPSRIDLAMQWTLARRPTETERAGALQLIQRIRRGTPKNSGPEVTAWTAWFHTLFTTAEFRYLVDVH